MQVDPDYKIPQLVDGFERLERFKRRMDEAEKALITATEALARFEAILAKATDEAMEGMRQR